ncbi:hypothetical protein BD560DRAFT_419654 [Blakeslea trispora]|nr:hypothetical protein BD560DRAFT_419654 [Blakeslea trispora]
MGPTRPCLYLLLRTLAYTALKSKLSKYGDADSPYIIAQPTIKYQVSLLIYLLNSKKKKRLLWEKRKADLLTWFIISRLIDSRNMERLEGWQNTTLSTNALVYLHLVQISSNTSIAFQFQFLKAMYGILKKVLIRMKQAET